MIKKLLVIFVIIGALAFGLFGLLYWHFYIRLLPEPIERTEIYRGVFYECGIWDDASTGSGKYMVAEIHLDEPGIEFFIRPFYPKSVRGRHYTLWPIDVLRSSLETEVILNGTLYDPHEWYQSLPGMKVDSLETLVVKSRPSHVDPKSYLLWFDEKMNSHMERTKPPSIDTLEKANWGIGMQGYLVNEGNLNWGSFVKEERQIKRTFIGVDPDTRLLWFMTFESVSPVGLGIFAIGKGVRFGGLLDAEEATTMVLGENPVGLKSFTGMRGKRPLACVLGIQADPLPAN